jgi:hypothetical protein
MKTLKMFCAIKSLVNKNEGDIKYNFAAFETQFNEET